MHVWEATLRPKDGEIQRTCKWWQGMLKLSGAEHFENGVALNRMDGENRWCLLLAYRILAGKVAHSFIVHM